VEYQEAQVQGRVVAPSDHHHALLGKALDDDPLPDPAIKSIAGIPSSAREPKTLPYPISSICPVGHDGEQSSR